MLQGVSVTPSNRAAEPAEPRPARASGGLAIAEEGRGFLRANPEVRDVFAKCLRLTLEERYRPLIAHIGLDDVRKARFLEYSRGRDAKSWASIS